MSTTDDARAMGTDRGRAAASWTFDGNTDGSTYLAFLEMWEAGDPAIDAYGPATGWLSGEYAEGPTPHELAHELGISTDPEDEEYDEYAIDEVCNAYEDAAEEAYWRTLEDTARRMLS